MIGLAPSHLEQHTPPPLSSPLILVTPRNNRRNQIIAPLIDQPHSAYYQLSGTETTFSELTHAVLSTLTMQGFAKIPANAGNSDQDAGKTLGTALKRASIETLILDQMDMLDADPGAWLDGLLSTLPNSAHVVLSGRSYNADYWNARIKDGSATLIGEADATGVHVLDGEPQRLEVYAFGIGEVWYEGRSVVRWDGPLTRRLFYYLLDQGPVSRLAIFETFWPNLPIREATNVFHVTKRKMNETIGCDATDYSDRHYAVSSSVRLHYDVADFEAALSEADAGQGDVSLNAWKRAIQIYRHPFLMQETTGWIATRRNELRDGYAQALISVARVSQKNNDLQTALMFYLRAIRETPLREDLYGQVMRLYAEQGNKAAAVAQYQHLKSRLSSQLGIAPTRELAQLNTQLSR